MCGDPMCPSCGPAQGCNPAEEAFYEALYEEHPWLDNQDADAVGALITEVMADGHKHPETVSCATCDKNEECPGFDFCPNLKAAADPIYREYLNENHPVLAAATEEQASKLINSLFEAGQVQARQEKYFGVDHHSRTNPSRACETHAPALLAMAQEIARMHRLMSDPIVKNRIIAIAVEQVRANHQELAETLNTLQGQENDGRGVGCVQSCVTFLRRGMVEEARAIAHTDWDKIRNYRRIARWLNENIFVDEPLR